MKEALFALAGAALGVLGTLIGDIRRSRKEDVRDRRESLRSACVEFAVAISDMRQLAYDRRAHGPDAELRTRVRTARAAARAQYERLRLCTDSLQAQEDARYALRYALGFWREAEGEPPRADEIDKPPIDQLEDRLVSLFIEVRRELGQPNPDRVFAEPAHLRGPVPPRPPGG